MSKPSFCIVGAGVVGTAVAKLLVDKGYPLVGVASRKIATAEQMARDFGVPATQFPWEITKEAQVVFLTTPDKEIEQVCTTIQNGGGFSPGVLVIHMSGALTSDVLAAAKASEALVMSLHPLQSFARVEEAVTNLPGSVFSIEGDLEAQELGFQLISDLGGQGFVIAKANKAIYHGAAVIAANYLVALTQLSTAMLGEIGIPPAQGTQALVPLMEGVLKNIKALGPAQALTGPIARGDIGTVAKHLESLAQLPNDYLEIYQKLGNYTVGIALEKGSIDSELASKLRAKLQ